MPIQINNVARRVVYAPTGTGGAGPYAFTFEILAAGDIAVYKDDTLLTLTTHYTVTINANGTGSVSITAAGLALSPTSPTQYAIVGNRTIQRITDYVTGGDFFANTINDELDSQTIFAQQNAEEVDRALKIPLTDPIGTNTTLPKASERLNKYLAFDGSGAVIVTSGTTTVPVSSAMSTVTSAASLSAGREAFGIGAFNTMTIGHGTKSSSPGYEVSNTALGQDVLKLNTTGLSNVGIGEASLKVNTTGSQNVAVGSACLWSNTTGTGSIAIGRLALFSATAASYSIAIGYESMQNSVGPDSSIGIGYRSLRVAGGSGTGIENVCIGAESGQSVTTADNNTAVGSRTLTLITTGAANTAIGAGSLRFAASGSYNTAVGIESMKGTAFTSGTYNTAIGAYAIYESTTGSHNVAIGANAGYGITTGSGNTIINPRNSSGTVAPVFSVTTENNRFVAGSTGVTNAYVQVAWTVVSDQRDKTNFSVVPHGLDFVMKMKPCSFQYRKSRDSDEPVGPVRYGFKAQDILDIEGSNPVVIDAEDPEKLKITDSSLVPILVKAIQELKEEIENLKLQLAN